MREYIRWQQFLSGVGSVLLVMVIIGGLCGFLVGLDGPYVWPHSGLYWGILIAGVFGGLTMAGVLFGLAQVLDLLERLAPGACAEETPSSKPLPTVIFENQHQARNHG